MTIELALLMLTLNIVIPIGVLVLLAYANNIIDYPNDEE